MRTIAVGSAVIGPYADRLTVIAGPCMAESLDLCLRVAEAAAEACGSVGMHYVFKASFDKANRTSGAAERGPGLDEGLRRLAAVRERVGVPVLTDIHEPWQARPVAEIVDILQIPAFLCRQTDLLVAAARTGRCVNIKKGQFLAPLDIGQAAAKVAAAGCERILLTERGVSFGYHTLVVDMTALPQMRSLGYPVCMDATHAVQRPGGAGTQSGGNREFVPHIARAAAAVGIDALFLETHPSPELALSDGASMLRLDDLSPLLEQVRDIDRVVRGHRRPSAPPAG
ncbi:MAG: 3-deoxy-8-phosphooctulonate synthase [Chthonomonadales bacterium]|nr:3-deoxy-8-phosphooctulonate synthase [Chthonomonadales bacterium]